MRITVSIKQQTLTLHQDDGSELTYRVSTSVKGTGQQNGSFQTPLGKHIIRAKVGEGAPAEAVFVSRRPTGEIYTTELAEQYPQRDWVLTRILWLSGTEVGFNRLGTVDTMRRYVYIHGCPAQMQMGVPGSHGCIRMHTMDVVDLFDRVPVGTEVDIRLH